MSFINIGTFTAFLTCIKSSGEPSNKNGWVNTDNAHAPPSTIFLAISTGSDIFLIFPNAGDENFISVINAACFDLIILSFKSIPEFGKGSIIS